MGGGSEGVYPGVRHGTVTAFALYFDFKIVRCRSTDAGSGNNDRPCREGHSRHHMDHQSSVDFRVLQQSCLDHVVGTLEDLFGRLEHQFYRSGDLGLVGLEKPGRTQQHGGVHIVTAGVHFSVLRRKIHIRLFRDRKRVHVGTQEKYLSWLFASDQRHDTGLAAVHRLETHIQKLAFYK